MTTEEIRTAMPLEKLPRDILRCRLDIYEEIAQLRFFNTDSTTVKIVGADDIAAALMANLDFNSGLLPKNCLWWKRQAGGGRVVAVWREPQVWNVALQVKVLEPPRRLALPMPGLLFVCKPGTTPYIFAAPEMPTREGDPLYKAPCFNVFRDGRVCPGSHRFPTDPDEIPESFFTSFFSQTGDYQGRSKSHPNKLIDLWDELDGTTVFPMNDLVLQQMEVADAFKIV